MPWMVIRFTGFTCRGRFDWSMVLEWTWGMALEWTGGWNVVRSCVYARYTVADLGF